MDNVAKVGGVDMSRLLGTCAALTDGWWSANGRQKAQSRRRQRARERQRSREGPAPCDPCGCRAWCPHCDEHCLAGHANYPTRHMCAELHVWDAPWPDG